MADRFDPCRTANIGKLITITILNYVRFYAPSVKIARFYGRHGETPVFTPFKGIAVRVRLRPHIGYMYDEKRVSKVDFGVSGL